MTRVLGCILVATGLVLCQGSINANQAMAESGLETINEYIELVTWSNYESAAQYWTEESQRRSSRFGIEYIDIPLKIDCASPIIRNPEASPSFNGQAIRSETTLGNDDYRRYTLEVTTAGDKLEHHYYTQLVDGYHWLTFAQDFFAKDWPPVLQTKYFTIRHQVEHQKYLNPIILDAADAFIEEMARNFGLSDDDLRLLEKEKINYVYCSSDNLVKNITGHLVKGTYDLASDDIISAFFPHYHELVHFMTNFKLRRLHLYTLPVFREGIAVLYGGRWGKSPTSMLTIGGYLHREDVVHIDSILTLIDFDRNAGADLAYPVAALFVGYIIEETSTEDLFDLYRDMSGGFEKVYDLTADEVKSTIVAKLGASDWDAVKTGFNDYVNRWLDEKVGVYPGTVDGGDIILKSGNLVVTKNEDWITLTATFPTGQVANGNLLFGLDSEQKLDASLLFEEQYRRQLDFENYRYGIRFDQNEVGIYDYATNHLLAKYIWGMAPSEAYYNQEENRVTLKYKTDIVNGQLPSPDNHLVLEN